MNIGENIRAHRIELGMTQEMLAKKLRVSSQAVSKWETGKSCPDVSLILPISEAFNISADARQYRKLSDADSITPLCNEI